MRRASLLVVLVALAAGCGGSDESASDALSPLGLSMAEGALQDAVASGDLELAYRRARAYAFAVESRVDDGELGEDDGRGLLDRAADDVRLGCGECAVVLERAADRLDG